MEDQSSNSQEMGSLGSSTETASTQVSNPSIRKKKLNWVINMIVETIEENIECEPVTMTLKKPKVRRVPVGTRVKRAGPKWRLRQFSLD